MSGIDGNQSPIERFAYPPDINVRNRVAQRNRLLYFYPLFGMIPCAFVLVAIEEGGWLWWVAAALAVGALVGMEVLLRHVDREEAALADSVVEFDSVHRSLRLLSPAGIIEIDLRRPHDARPGVYAAGRFVVTVSQDDTRLRFSSSVTDARRLLVEILGGTWPEAPG